MAPGREEGEGRALNPPAILPHNHDLCPLHSHVLNLNVTFSSPSFRSAGILPPSLLSHHLSSSPILFLRPFLSPSSNLVFRLSCPITLLS